MLSVRTILDSDGIGLADVTCRHARGRGRPVEQMGGHATAADGVREALSANPDCSLRDLAPALALSSHHPSRVFHASTGHTVARYRMRLRTRAPLDRLAVKERSLARLTADVGFADQSHLCRVLQGETGQSPSALRQVVSWTQAAQLNSA